MQDVKPFLTPARYALIARVEITARGWDPLEFYRDELGSPYGDTEEGIDRLLVELGRELMAVSGQDGAAVLS